MQGVITWSWRPEKDIVKFGGKVDFQETDQRVTQGAFTAYYWSTDDVWAYVDPTTGLGVTYKRVNYAAPTDYTPTPPPPSPPFSVTAGEWHGTYNGTDALIRVTTGGDVFWILGDATPIKYNTNVFNPPIDTSVLFWVFGAAPNAQWAPSVNAWILDGSVVLYKYRSDGLNTGRWQAKYKDQVTWIDFAGEESTVNPKTATLFVDSVTYTGLVAMNIGTQWVKTIAASNETKWIKYRQDTQTWIVDGMDGVVYSSGYVVPIPPLPPVLPDPVPDSSSNAILSILKASNAGMTIAVVGAVVVVAGILIAVVIVKNKKILAESDVDGKTNTLDTNTSL